MISGISHALFLLPVPMRHQAGPCTLNTLNMVTQRNVNLSVTFATCPSEHLPEAKSHWWKVPKCLDEM